VKYAGTVTTAFVNRMAEVSSAVCFFSVESLQTTSGGVYRLPPTSTSGHIVRAGLRFYTERALIVLGIGSATAHEALMKRCVGRVGDRLTLGNLTNNRSPFFRETHDGRGSTNPLRVRDYDRVAAFKDGDHRVCGTEVDTDDFSSHFSLF